MGVVITGTIDGPDGLFARVNAVGETYEEAKAALGAMVPERTLSRLVARAPGVSLRWVRDCPGFR